MTDSVIIPIELQVNDLDMSKVNLNDVQKDVTSKMSGLKQSVSKIFNTIDTSKFTNSMSTAMGKVLSTVQKATDAQREYNNALDVAAHSTTSYKRDADEANLLVHQLGNIRRAMDDIDQISLRGQMDKFAMTGEIGPLLQQYNAYNQLALQKGEQLDALQQKLADSSNYASEAQIKYTSAVENAYASMVNAIIKANQASDQWNTSMQSNKFSDEYMQLSNSLNTIDSQLSKVNDKVALMQMTGATDSQWTKYTAEATLLKSKLDEIVGKMQEMVQTGSAFRFGASEGDATAEVERLNSVHQQLSNTFENVTNTAQSKASALQFETEEEEEDETATKKNVNIHQAFTKVLKTLGNVITGISHGIRKVASNILSMGKHSKKTTTDMSKRFKSLWRTILMYGLGFRSMYFFIKKIRTAFKDAFKEMSKQIPEINTQISSLVTAFNQVKGSIGTAFQPIVSVAIPALVRLCNTLNTAMVTLGKFFATLSGQNFIYKFTAKQVDYAKSLDKTSKAAKNAKNSLMGFDELNVLNDKSGSDDDSTGTWEKEALDAPNKLAELIKNAWSNNGRFTEVGKYLGENLLNALTVANKIVTGKGKAFVDKIGSSIATLFNGFFCTPGLANEIGKLVGNAINTGMSGVETFLTMTNWPSIGQFISDWATSALNTFDANLFGKILGDLIGAGIDVVYQFASTFDFSQLGTKLSDSINSLFASLNEVDANGMSNAAKLGSAASNIIKGLIDAMATAVKNTDWSSVGKAIGTMFANMDWSGIIESAKELISGIVEGLGEMFDSWEEVDSSSASIAKIIAVIGTLGPVIAKILPIIDKIVLGITKLISNFDKIISVVKTVVGVFKGPFGGIVAIITGVITAVSSFVDMLVNGFSWAKEAAMLLGIALTAVGAIILGAPAAIAAVVAGIVAVVTNIIIWLKENWQAVCDFFAGLWEVIKSIFLGALTILKDLIVGVFLAIKNAIVLVWNQIKAFFVMVWEILKNTVTTVINTIKNIIVTVFTTIKNSIVTIFTTIKEVIVTIFTTIKTFISRILCGDIKGAISTALNGIKKVWETIWNGLKKYVGGVFEGIWNVIKFAINGIIGLINGLVSGVVKGVNVIIRALNSISVDVPDWVPGIGGETFGFNIPELKAPQIPKLAKGAVIPPNDEFMAILGDQKRGTNIEAPLDTIKQAVNEELAEYIEAMMVGFESVVAAIDAKDMEIAIGDTVIGKAAERYNSRQKIVRGI